VRRIQVEYEHQGKSAFAAIAGLPQPRPGASWSEIAGAARVQIAAQTREALKSEFPALIEQFGPVLEARFMEKILPAIEGKMKEALPALVTELAPVIGESLVRAGTEFLAAQRTSNIEASAAKAGLAKIPPQIDVGELLKKPEVQALAEQYGIDTSTLKNLPKKIAVPQGGNPLSLLAAYVPQLKPLVSALDAIKAFTGIAGGGATGGGVHAISSGPTSQGDKDFAERVLRR